MTTPPKTVRLKIQRFDPKTDTAPHYDTFQVTTKPRMTVLDALFQVLEKTRPFAGVSIFVQERSMRKLRELHQRQTKAGMQHAGERVRR